MTPLKLKHVLLAGLATFSLGAGAQQAWPDRPISLVVPFAAGGPTDVVARMLAIPMGKALGQPVTVENAVGAGGTIAATKVARAQPNGYTVFLHHMGMSTAPALYKKLQFDPLKDFEYIGQVVDVPMTLLARKDFPASNFQELQAHLKREGNKVSLANAGLGAVSHLCGLLFQSAMGVELTTVPFGGTGPAMNALLGSQVDLLCDQTTNTTSQIEGKKVKAYAVTTAKRLTTPALKDLPTLDEAGQKNFQVTIWHGMYAPKGTPAAVQKKLNDALKVALKDPEFLKKQEGLGAVVVSDKRSDPAEHKKFVQAEIAKWSPVIKAAGVYAD